MKRFFSWQPLWQQTGITLLRLLVGIFIIIHGYEVFSPEKMKNYMSWDTFHAASYLPYIGKGAEFVAGVLLFLGFLTRLACFITIGTFCYITFFVGSGKYWMDDQHPFLFVVIAAIFFFTGPGPFSMDRMIFGKK